MTKDMSQHQKEFYEEYWKQRENKNYIHTKNDMWIPPRIRVAVNMILRDYNINGIIQYVFLMSVVVRERSEGCLQKD